MSKITVFSLAAFLFSFSLSSFAANGQSGNFLPRIKQHRQGLHGYIGYQSTRPPDKSQYNMGMGFYSAVWSLIDKPIAGFQIGLAGSWILPDNSDNKTKPLAPEGTRARNNMSERGPTYGDVFQTLEGGLGFWASNRFRYGSPKFSMNATPQCYDYEIGSPGWSFFHSTQALPDDRLGIAQLSNRLLIPPDALPFAGNPQGKFLGYAYMALPFTDPTLADPPTGEQSWTCFLNAQNFKGPIAYYIPETWSKIGKLFDYPFLYGRGLDARPAIMGGGAMEINTVPCFESSDSKGIIYSKIPQLQFPVDHKGRSILVQDVTYYSKAALYDDFKKWRKGGPLCSGIFLGKGSWKAKLKANKTRYTQNKIQIEGVDRILRSHVHAKNIWGLRWGNNKITAQGDFPQYFQKNQKGWIPVSANEVPEETGLKEKEFKNAMRGIPFTSPKKGAWTEPGPVRGPYTATLVDGSIVTYYWYRFIDQPSFQQYSWSEEKKRKLQDFVEKIHAHWTINKQYMKPPTTGCLVSLDPALLVTPPNGLEHGYVPIVTQQEDFLSLRNLGEKDIEKIMGHYRREPVKNGWHKVEIILDKSGGVLNWKNKANVNWTLEFINGRLWTGGNCPYGSIQLNLEWDQAGQVSKINFMNEAYVRLSALSTVNVSASVNR